MVLIIDNYDSFTYNLFQYVEELGYEAKVARNDEITLDEIEKLRPERIILSPGPGAPDSAGITLAVIKRFSGLIPLLGVCLGHQAIGQAFGAEVVRASVPRHGKTSAISHCSDGLFKGLQNPFPATRYHSLIVEDASLPRSFEVTARSEDGTVMGIRHRFLPVNGVQFHPESIATGEGKALLANFLSRGGVL